MKQAATRSGGLLGGVTAVALVMMVSCSDDSEDAGAGVQQSAGSPGEASGGGSSTQQGTGGRSSIPEGTGGSGTSAGGDPVDDLPSASCEANQDGGSETVAEPELIATLSDRWHEAWLGSPAVADLDEDGEQEIIVPRDELLLIWHLDGSVVHRFEFRVERRKIIAEIYHVVRPDHYAGTRPGGVLAQETRSTRVIQPRAASLTAFFIFRFPIIALP